MDPKSAASSALSSLSASINSGAPQYTPPGTPSFAAEEPVKQAAPYTPPSFNRVIPPSQFSPTPVSPIAVAPTPTQPLPMQPAPQPIPQMPHPMPNPSTPTPQYQAPTPQPQMYAPRPIVVPTPPLPQSTFNMNALSPSHMDTAHMVQTPTTPRKSRLLPIALGIFLVLLLLVTGIMYFYGSMLVARRAQPQGLQAPAGQQLPTAVPANGFQVTESSVFEPNFDQQQAQPSTPSGVNADIDAMFEE